MSRPPTFRSVGLSWVSGETMEITNQTGALHQILSGQQITSLFQPIVSLSAACVHGYEALSRGPSNSPLHSPLTLFPTARSAGRLYELEMACKASACEAFSQRGFAGKLFINVSPDTLLDPAHRPGRTLELLKFWGVPPDQVVIELTEQAPTDDFALIDRALHHYREMGFSIALDDLGAGYSSLRLWSELRPDYVKIDRYFIDGIHHDVVKREFVGSILDIARASNTQVIAEGIEMEEELVVLQDMGVDLVQGYLFGRPLEAPDQSGAGLLWGQRPGLPGAAAMMPQSQPLSAAVQRFRSDSGLQALALHDDHGRPVARIRRAAYGNGLPLEQIDLLLEALPAPGALLCH